jgi:hypothetical protein
MIKRSYPGFDRHLPFSADIDLARRIGTDLNHRQARGDAALGAKAADSPRHARTQVRQQPLCHCCAASKSLKGACCAPIASGD